MTGLAACRARCSTGVGIEPVSQAPTIPHMLYMSYQATFAIITAALISGSIVERMRFSAYLAFISLWGIVVYAPIAHWVWGGGWLAKMGALDFAGGTVVHVNAAMAAVACAIAVGNRREYPVVVAAAAQRAVHAARRRRPVVRMVRLQRGQRAGGQRHRRPRLHGHVPGAGRDAGRLDVPRLHPLRKADRGWRGDRHRRRPRRHYAGGRLRRPDGRDLARRHRGDSELPRAAVAREDEFRRFARRACGARRRRHGRRAADRRLRAEGVQRRADGLLYGNPGQLGIQAIAVAAAAIYSFVVSFALVKLIGLVIPLRPSAEDETTGLDISQHGEEAYLHVRRRTTCMAGTKAEHRLRVRA